jgi:threonine/homoserine/homoserine lactone efflux protein
MTSGLNQTSHALTLVASIMSGSMLWWSGLSGLISRIRHKLNHNRLRMINQAAGGLLLVFGAVLFFQFTYGLLDYYQGQASVAR